MAHLDLSEVADAFAAGIPSIIGQVDQLVRAIPPGSVTTYGDLAKSLGDSAASRWVATYLLDPACGVADLSHRVVRSTGEIGLHCSGSSETKTQLLRGEGVVINRGTIDLETHRLQLPPMVASLSKLKAWQRDFACPGEQAFHLSNVKSIGGIDVSYGKEQAISACARMQADGQTKIGTHTCTGEAKFPYITGYLAFREIPLHLHLLAEMQAAGKLPDVLLVDGNGRLHPRRMGIATMLGGLTGIPTIGVAKKLICGVVQAPELKVGKWEPIIASQDAPDEILGYAIMPHTKTKHPIYVSRGFGIDDTSMKEVVDRCLAGHRLPEPIYWADRESRQLASTR
ncbi:Endonuclease V [Bremerella volcania]|uniref:Endonuclease V n=1 Tax=Bremerella volcania TaxID=2527984 RepID=A0A518CD89_9BACT|nr:endonuclease V [Bremerella volcania]QDU77188.1 Endonuclease V [Bremerella volcania]